MRLDINVNVHFSDFPHILERLTHMAIQLDELEATLARNTDATDSVVVLITTLRQDIIDAGTDPVKLREVTDKLQANTDKLAAAAVANT